MKFSFVNFEAKIRFMLKQSIQRALCKTNLGDRLTILVKMTVTDWSFGKWTRDGFVGRQIDVKKREEQII